MNADERGLIFDNKICVHPRSSAAQTLMKIWLSKNSEVPVREQLVTQIKLGITSGDLATGARLASTSEMARRYGIHANTVSNAYQLLVEQGWLEFKKGSGFFVRETTRTNQDDSLAALVARFAAAARELGFTNEQVREHLARYFENQKTARLIVIENDAALREILIGEINAAAKISVSGASFDEIENELNHSDAHFAALFDEKERVSRLLPPDKNCFFLKANSPAASMTGKVRPPADELLAIVSGWEKFLAMAKTMLVAAQIEPESLLIRSTKEANWRKGLGAASMIICDSVTAGKLSEFQNVSAFRLIAEESLSQIATLDAPADVR